MQEQMSKNYRKIILDYVNSLSEMEYIVLNNSQDVVLSNLIFKSFKKVTEFCEGNTKMQDFITTLTSHQHRVFHIFQNFKLRQRSFEEAQIKNTFCCKIHEATRKQQSDLVKHISISYFEDQQVSQNLFLVMKQLCQKIQQSGQSIYEQQFNDALSQLQNHSIFSGEYPPMQFMFDKTFTKLSRLQITYKQKECRISSFWLFQFISLNQQSLTSVIADSVFLLDFNKFVKFFRVLNKKQNCIARDDETLLSKRIIELQGQNHHVLEMNPQAQQVLKWIGKLGRCDKSMIIRIKAEFYLNRDTDTLEPEEAKRRIQEGIRDLVYFSGYFSNLQHVQIITTFMDNALFGMIGHFQSLLQRLKFKKVQIAIEDLSKNSIVEILSEDSFLYQFIIALTQSQRTTLYGQITSLKFIKIKFTQRHESEFAKFRAIMEKSIRWRDLVYFGSIESNISSIFPHLFQNNELVSTMKCDIEIKGESNQLIEQIFRKNKNRYSCKLLELNVINSQHLQCLKDSPFHSSKTVSISNFEGELSLLELTQISKLECYRSLTTLKLKNINFSISGFELFQFPHLERVILQQCFVTEQDLRKLQFFQRKQLICARSCHIYERDEAVQVIEGKLSDYQEGSLLSVLLVKETYI